MFNTTRFTITDLKRLLNGAEFITECGITSVEIEDTNIYIRASIESSSNRLLEVVYEINGEQKNIPITHKIVLHGSLISNSEFRGVGFDMSMV